MDDKLLIGAQSSLFVSRNGILTFAALTLLCAILKASALSLAFGFLFFLCLTSRLWGEHALKHVRASCEGTPLALFPPGEVTLRFSLKNDKLLPLIWLEIVQFLDEDAPLIPADPDEVRRVPALQAQIPDAQDGQEVSFLYKKFTFIMGGEELQWESCWNARRRGIFRPAQLRLRSGDGFGLTQTERRITDAETAPVAIYPALQPVLADTFLRNTWETSGGSRGYLEDPTLISSTRPYTPEDSFRRINWRLTARSQQTMVNTYEKIQPRSVCFILDGESFNGPDRQDAALEDTLSILTSLILRLHRSGIHCAVALPRSRTAPAREIFGAEQTPMEEILLAFAGYELCPLIQPEDPRKPPYAAPSVFREEHVLSLRNTGRFYYVCSAPDRVQPRGLISRLEQAKTVLMPYTLPDSSGDPALQGFPVMGLCSLKGGQ